ncbi:hypothetical protein HPB49_023721 [Dermacentor silvarum]|uniref:Uncharacterized protein n=1 Tax=Dermacentor silvarum TaxID=543639 RepID=A0ACB8DGY0_DERSI|nr:hypothetical protein HPB49_023721 [Dermacentor silvarum]
MERRFDALIGTSNGEKFELTCFGAGITANDWSGDTTRAVAVVLLLLVVANKLIDNDEGAQHHDCVGDSDDEQKELLVGQVGLLAFRLPCEILSLGTASQLQRVCIQWCNIDLQWLLAASEHILDCLCGLMDGDPSFRLGAVRCRSLAPALLGHTTKAMLESCTKHKRVMFGLLVAEH